MSYILDALRKADAQRESGSSRGIHAHPTPLGESDSSGARPVWWWGAGAVVVALISWGGWSLVKDKEAPAPAASAVASAPSAAAPPAAAVAKTPPPAPAPAAAIEPPPPAAEVVAPPAGMHAPQPRQTAQGPGMGVPPMTLPAQAPARVAPPPAAAATAAGSAPVSTVSGLPPDAPRVSISGGVYSPNPVQRMLIVNGQVFNEGSEVAPGLAIDEIRPRTAILKFRGARYTVTY
jgi:general secretion pathway protein B